MAKKNTRQMAMLLTAALTAASLTACGQAESAGGSETASITATQEQPVMLEGTLEELINKIYEGVTVELPGTGNTPITADMSEFFLGVTADRYLEAQSGDAMINAVPHSVCLVRAKSVDDVEALKKDIEAKANPNKWICVMADKVIVDSIGDVILLVMSNEETADAVQESFLALNK